MNYSLDKGKPSRPIGRCRLTLLALALVGAVLLVGGSVVYVRVFPQALREKLAQALTIRAGSEAEERFVRSPVHTYTAFYLFNVTNKEQVNGRGAKPRLQELGPYVFRLEREREILGWDESRGTLRYQEVKRFFFEAGKSKGKLGDLVNHVNAVSIGLATHFQHQSPVLRALGMSAEELIRDIRGQLLETHSVLQLLFQGFGIRQYFPEDYEHFCRLKDNCTFSFWKNATRTLVIEIKTGSTGIDDIQHVVKYNNQSSLPYWFGDTCNALNGTVGPQFKPGLTRYDSFFAFSPELCRSMEFRYEGPSQVEGISTLRFHIREDALSYKTQDNRCFCSDKDPCQPDHEGLFLVGPCHEGGPVAISWPHFYLGTPEQVADFEGLQPQKSKHHTYVDIEPITGTAINGFKRIQANIVVKPDSRISFLENINRTIYFPVFWAEESGSISEELAAQFQSKVMTPFLMGKWSLLAAIGVGALVMLLTLIAWTLKRPI